MGKIGSCIEFEYMLYLNPRSSAGNWSWRLFPSWNIWLSFASLEDPTGFLSFRRVSESCKRPILKIPSRTVLCSEDDKTEPRPWLTAWCTAKLRKKEVILCIEEGLDATTNMVKIRWECFTEVTLKLDEAFYLPEFAIFGSRPRAAGISMAALKFLTLRAVLSSAIWIGSDSRVKNQLENLLLNFT